MAGLAGTLYLIMVYRGFRRPGRTRMTGFAYIAGIDMRRILTGGNRAIVATGTCATYLVMIHCGHWRPGYTRMAGFTHLTGIYVGGSFAGGDDAIMTANAGISDRAVINTRTQPSGSNVANITSSRSHNM